MGLNNWPVAPWQQIYLPMDHLPTDLGTITVHLQTLALGLHTHRPWHWAPCRPFQLAQLWTLPTSLYRISGQGDWWRTFPAKATLQRLEVVTAYSNVQIKTQGYKDHEESGNMIPLKEQNKSPERDPTAICEMSDKELKIIISKSLVSYKRIQADS